MNQNNFMKHLIYLLLFVFCLFGQGCTNDDTIIEDCPSQKCGMTPEEVEVRVEEIRKNTLILRIGIMKSKTMIRYQTKILIY